MNTTLAELATNRYENSLIAVWGFGYWAAALVKPDLVANFSTTLSVAGMVLMGAVILGNLVLDSDVVWVLLGLFMTSGIASSWVVTTEWAVPYPQEYAAISMTFFNAVTAVVSFAKVLDGK